MLSCAAAGWVILVLYCKGLVLVMLMNSRYKYGLSLIFCLDFFGGRGGFETFRGLCPPAVDDDGGLAYSSFSSPSSSSGGGTKRQITEAPSATAWKALLSLLNTLLS